MSGTSTDSSQSGVRVYTLKSTTGATGTSSPATSPTTTTKRRRSSSSSEKAGSPLTTTTTFSRILRTIFRTLTSVAVHVGKGTYKATRASLTRLYAALCSALRVLFAPLRYARRLAHMSTRLLLRYLRTMLTCVFAVWIVVFSWSDGALKVWVAEENPYTTTASSAQEQDVTQKEANGDESSPRDPEPHRSKDHTSRAPLSTRQRLKHANAIIVKHLLAPLKAFLLFGIPQITYEMLRLWHIVLLHGGTAIYDTLRDAVDGAVRLLQNSGAAPLLRKWGVRLEPTTGRVRVSGMFRRKLLASMKPTSADTTTTTVGADGSSVSTKSNQSKLIRAYFDAWDVLACKLNRASVPKAEGAPQQSSPPSQLASLEGGLHSIWDTVRSNDTRQLTARQGVVQLLRPWQIFGASVPLPSAPAQLATASKHATRKVGALVRSSGRQVLSQLPEERRKQILGAYQNTVNKLTTEAVDGDGGALTVCGLMQSFFAAVSAEAGAKELLSTAAGTTTGSAHRAIWTRVPEETVRLTYLDASLG